MVIFMKNIIKDRGGWIEIVEAFVAVLLVAGVILIVLNRGGFQKTEISEKVYQAELSILREIESNDTLREDIVLAEEPMPVEWGDVRFPTEVKKRIIIRTPNYLTCIGKICNMNQTCVTEETEEGDIYSQAVAIISTLQNITFRKLNLFCWTR